MARTADARSVEGQAALDHREGAGSRTVEQSAVAGGQFPRTRRPARSPRACRGSPLTYRRRPHCPQPRSPGRPSPGAPWIRMRRGPGSGAVRGRGGRGRGVTRRPLLFGGRMIQGPHRGRVAVLRRETDARRIRCRGASVEPRTWPRNGWAAGRAHPNRVGRVRETTDARRRGWVGDSWPARRAVDSTGGPRDVRLHEGRAV